MFNSDLKKTIKELEEKVRSRDSSIDSYARQEKRMIQTHELALEKIKQVHRMELEEKEFRFRHAPDETMKKAEYDLNRAQNEINLLRKEIEMLKSRDVFDVKDLLKNIITKLPVVNISDLNISK